MILTPDFAHIFPWKKMGSFIQSIAGHGLHRFHRFYRSTSTTIWKLPQNFFHNGYLGSGFVDLVLQRQQKNGIWSVVHGNPSFAWRIFPKKNLHWSGRFPVAMVDSQNVSMVRSSLESHFCPITNGTFFWPSTSFRQTHVIILVITNPTSSTAPSAVAEVSD